MARILNNPFGELRGKGPGGVFTRTKAGQILRSYVKPADTKTARQIAVRSLFGSLVQSFCNLSSAAKAAWNAFAINGAKFNAKNSTNRGQYTGLNAYSSLRMAATRAEQLATEPQTLFAGVTPGTLTSVFNNFVALDSPPNFVTTPHLKSHTVGPSGNYSWAAVTGVSSAGLNLSTNILTLDLSYTADGTVEIEEFINEWGVGWGIQVMASEPLKDESNRPKNPELFTLCTIRQPKLTSPLSLDYNGRITITAHVASAELSKYNIQAGKNYDVTVYAVSLNGAFAKIGQGNLAVTLS